MGQRYRRENEKVSLQARVLLSFFIFFVSGRIHSAADYVLTPHAVVVVVVVVVPRKFQNGITFKFFEIST